jgi:hypothetical protein
MTDAPAALALAPTLSACGGSGDHGLRHIADLLLTYELVDDEEFDVSTVTGG